MSLNFNDKIVIENHQNLWDNLVAKICHRILVTILGQNSSDTLIFCDNLVTIL